MITNLGLTDDELFAYLIQEAEANFAGWDFSYIRERYISAALPWSYDMKVWPKVRRANTLLDMDTGGGEKLASFQPLPAQTYATEAYQPNVELARQKLAPFGVTVIAIEDEQAPLPFADTFFDLILNRHGAFDPADLFRVLKPGGLFITQQVGDQNNREYPTLFGLKDALKTPRWSLQIATTQLKNAGFTMIEQKEDLAAARIYDVGAMVYYLKAIPWTLPGITHFTVEAYFDQLKAIHQTIQKKGYIDIGEHRFFIIAQK